MKKCTKCGIDKELSQFNKDKKNKDGLRCYCKTCNSNIGKKWNENNKEWKNSCRAAYARTTEGKYIKLKASAKERSLEMQISLKQYVEIIKDNKCYYCDASLVGSAGHSLNRIDSNKGYLVENVKPCCKFCNRIMSNYSIEELSNRVYKIVARMKKLQE